MAENKGFMLYRAYLPIIRDLTPEEIGELMLALFDYFETWEQPEIENRAVRMAFIIISQDMVKADERWQKRCARNAENGERGGRPRKEEKPSGFLENPEKPSGFLENPEKPKETEKTQRKEKENINIKENIKREVKEKKETAAEAVDRLTAELGMSDDMRETLRTWVRYKTEKRQPYKAEGLRALIGQANKAAETFGEQAVISLVADCMACGYTGIIFDRLKKEKPPDKKRTRFDNFPAHGTDYDAIMWASVAGGKT